MLSAANKAIFICNRKIANGSAIANSIDICMIKKTPHGYQKLANVRYKRRNSMFIPRFIRKVQMENESEDEASHRATHLRTFHLGHFGNSSCATTFMPKNAPNSVAKRTKFYSHTISISVPATTS